MAKSIRTDRPAAGRYTVPGHLRLLSATEWKVLWARQEKNALPKKAPNLKWAYLNLAKLGRWHDSKRTGRAGWVVMWDGWFSLQTLVEGYELAMSLDQKI